MRPGNRMRRIGRRVVPALIFLTLGFNAGASETSNSESLVINEWFYDELSGKPDLARIRVEAGEHRVDGFRELLLLRNSGDWNLVFTSPVVDEGHIPYLYVSFHNGRSDLLRFEHTADFAASEFLELEPGSREAAKVTVMSLESRAIYAIKRGKTLHLAVSGSTKGDDIRVKFPLNGSHHAINKVYRGSERPYQHRPGSATAYIEDMKAAENALLHTENHSKMLSLLRPWAERGYAEAQSMLGLAYFEGLGVNRDRRMAVRLFRKAAEGSDRDAQLDLGLSFLEGEGVSRDYSKAVYWLRRAARQGHATAQAQLGDMYEKGRGVPRSEKRAIQWWVRAARGWNPSARDKLKERGIDWRTE